LPRRSICHDCGKSKQKGAQGGKAGGRCGRKYALFRQPVIFFAEPLPERGLPIATAVREGVAVGSLYDMSTFRLTIYGAIFFIVIMWLGIYFIERFLKLS
jgi:hypothetical protein